MKAFGQITNGISADGHVFDQAKNAHAIGNFDAVLSLQEFSDQRTDFVVLYILLRRHGHDQSTGDVLGKARDFKWESRHVMLGHVREHLVVDVGP